MQDHHRFGRAVGLESTRRLDARRLAASREIPGSRIVKLCDSLIPEVRRGAPGRRRHCLKALPQRTHPPVGAQRRRSPPAVGFLAHLND